LKDRNHPREKALILNHLKLRFSDYIARRSSPLP
jgi:hypothetical protein